MADVDGDGIPDLAVTYGAFAEGDDGISILLGNGDGTFLDAQRFAAGPGPSSVVAADLNGDGLVDVITANSGARDVSVLLANPR